MQKKLSTEDVKKLSKVLIPIALFTGFSIIVFTFIYTFILQDSFTDDNNFTQTPIVFLGIIGLFFVFVIGYMVYAVIYDIRKGIKNTFEGIVADKKTDINKQTRTKTGSRKGTKKSTSTSYDYFIIVNDMKHKIDVKMFNDISVGDHIYFEIAPKSNKTLFYTIIDKKISVNHSPKQSYPTSKTKEAPLQQQDMDSLKAFFENSIIKKIQNLAFFTLPIIVLIYLDLQVLLVFMFPYPLILGYRFYKTIRLYINYKKALNSGRKQLINTQVIDKLDTTISTNGTKSYKRTIRTTYGEILVTGSLFSTLNAGDEITIHQTKFLNQCLGITLNEIYYPI